MSDKLIGLVLLLVSGFFYWQSLHIRRPPFAAFEALGAEVFPRAVVGLLAALSAVLLLKGKGPLLPAIDGKRLRVWLQRYRLPLLSIALFAAYVVLVSLAGWVAASFAYLVVMQLVLRGRRGWQLAYVVAGSLAFSWLLAELFERFFHVVLPKPSIF